MCRDAPRPSVPSLQRRIHRIDATHHPETKRKQRDFVLECVEAVFDVDNGDVNVWWYDDLLRKEKGTVTSLTMDALLRFGHGRLCVFAPNMKSDVVDVLRELPPRAIDGRLFTGTGCACRFNDRWAAEMRRRGGLDVVMLDGFGGVTGNIADVLRQLVDLRVFRHRHAHRPPVRLMVVFSDRVERQALGSVLDASFAAVFELSKLFRGTPYTLEFDSHERYGVTMQALCCSMVEHVPPNGAARAGLQWTDGVPPRAHNGGSVSQKAPTSRLPCRRKKSGLWWC